MLVRHKSLIKVSPDTRTCCWQQPKLRHRDCVRPRASMSPQQSVYLGMQDCSCWALTLGNVNATLHKKFSQKRHLNT